MIDDSPRCRSIVSYPLYRLAVYLSPLPATLKFIHRRNGRDNRFKSPASPSPPCFPKYPAHRKFPISELPASLRGPVNFQPRKRLSPPIFTSLYELRFNTRRYYARSVCVYIWRVGGKNIRKKLRPLLRHRMGEKTCGGREREREKWGS